MISSSIEFVIENIDHENIASAELPPMMEIKLGLYNKDVLFNAKDIHVAGSNPDIWAMVCAASPMQKSSHSTLFRLHLGLKGFSMWARLSRALTRPKATMSKI